MEEKNVHFVLDKKLKELNEEVERLVFNINNPLAGGKVHLLNIFTKEVMKAYVAQSQYKITKHPIKEETIISTTYENYELPELELPPLEEAEFELPPLVKHSKKGTLTLQPRFPQKQIVRETMIKEKVPKPIPKPQPIVEERISLITSKITGEEMAYAIKKGLFYIVNETEVSPNEIQALNFMKPSIEKDLRLFQNKERFIKLMKKAARKCKIDAEELSPSKLRYFLIKHIMNFGLIDPLLQDPFITKITCEGPNLKLRIVRENKEFITNLEYKAPAQLDEFLQNTGRKKGTQISEQNPHAVLEFDNFKIEVSFGIGANTSNYIIEKTI